MKNSSFTFNYRTRADTADSERLLQVSASFSFQGRYT